MLEGVRLMRTFFLRHVQALEDSKRTGLEISIETRTWLPKCPMRIRKRLEEMDLLDRSSNRTIEMICEWYSAKSGKNSTVKGRNDACANLKIHFGEGTDLAKVSAREAYKFKEWLLEKGRVKTHPKFGKTLSVATVARRIKHFKTMFKYAVDSGWLESNPFDGIKAGKQSNPKRSEFVEVERFEKMAEELPTTEVRLIAYLMRYCGLHPVEVYHLKWSDINFDTWLMSYRTPKTEHIDGLEYRTTPIFVEVQTLFDDQWQICQAGYVCPTLRQLGRNRDEMPGRVTAWIVEKMRFAAKRAGVKFWKKPTTNLRATRATEVANEYGQKCESEWIGHGVKRCNGALSDGQAVRY